jgi:DNA modification methylase
LKPYYQHAGITIYHGDCREILGEFPVGRCVTCAVDMQDEAVLAIHLTGGHELRPFQDLLCTDPPYGLGAARRAFGGNGVKRRMTGLLAGKCVPKRDYGDSGWDDAPADDVALRRAISLTEWQIIFGGNYFELGKARCWLVWDKLRGDTDYADAELAWTNLNKAVRVIRYRWNGFLTEGDPRDERVHPTQKPVAVIHWAIRQVMEDFATVLDPWMGSGTTLFAAKLLNKSAIGIEIEEKYCEIAAKRLSQEVLNFSEVIA